MRLLHITHEVFELHSNGTQHPERPERLRAVVAGVQAASGIDVVEGIPPPADMGALIAAGPLQFSAAKFFGLLAVILASVNIFGGFIVTQRMLAMFRKRK